MLEFIPGAIVMGLCAAIFLIFGLILVIWKKIELLHSYHWKNVKDDDKKIYCINMGASMIFMGAACLAGALINAFMQAHWGWISFGAGLVIGFAYMWFVQRKYNGGFF